MIPDRPIRIAFRLVFCLSYRIGKIGFWPQHASIEGSRGGAGGDATPVENIPRRIGEALRLRSRLFQIERAYLFSVRDLRNRNACYAARFKVADSTNLPSWTKLTRHRRVTSGLREKRKHNLFSRGVQ